MAPEGGVSTNRNHASADARGHWRSPTSYTYQYEGAMGSQYDT